MSEDRPRVDPDDVIPSDLDDTQAAVEDMADALAVIEESVSALPDSDKEALAAKREAYEAVVIARGMFRQYSEKEPDLEEFSR